LYRWARRRLVLRRRLTLLARVDVLLARPRLEHAERAGTCTRARRSTRGGGLRLLVHLEDVLDRGRELFDVRRRDVFDRRIRFGSSDFLPRLVRLAPKLADCLLAHLRRARGSLGRCLDHVLD
jgi:hypothetical protein